MSTVLVRSRRKWAALLVEHSVADLSGEQRQGRQVASYLLDTLSRSTVGTYDASVVLAASLTNR